MYVKIQYRKKIRARKKETPTRVHLRCHYTAFLSDTLVISASHVRIHCHLQAAMLQTICIGNYVARGDLCVTGNQKE